MDPSLALAVVSVLVSSGAVLYIARSGPIAGTRVLQDLRDRVVAAEAATEEAILRAERIRESVEGVLEELEGTHARVERTRRKNAAAVARLQREKGRGPDGLDPDLDPADALLLGARRMGLNV